MKQVLTISFLVAAFCGNAQSKKQREAMNNASMLETAVFEKKDSLVLEKLFAETVSFSWPDGRTESRAAALSSIMNNRSAYEAVSMPAAYGVKEVADSLLVDHVYNTKENKPGDPRSIRSYLIESVWAREGNRLKLFRCRIINYQ